MNVAIKTNGTQTVVESPYHPSFPPAARKLGGRWDGTRKSWVFDARDEERVHELCRTIYGTDGTESDLVDVRVTLLTQSSDCLSDRETELYLFGRQVGRVYGRDSGAQLGEGVVVLSGKFDSGGSRKNPAICWDEGTTIELRDVPRAAIQESNKYSYEIVELRIDRTALEAERDKLVDRLAEIDRLLSE